MMTLLKKPEIYRQDAKGAKKIKVWLNISCNMARIGTDFQALVQESWRSLRLCGKDSLFAVESHDSPEKKSISPPRHKERQDF